MARLPNLKTHPHVHTHIYNVYIYVYIYIFIFICKYTNIGHMGMYVHIYICIYIYICMSIMRIRIRILVGIHMAVDQNPGCRGPLLCYKPLSRALCYKTLSRTSAQSTVVFKGLVAEGFVAEHPCLLQTFVAKWPPKPVTDAFDSLPYLYTKT